MFKALPLLLLAGGCASAPVWTSFDHLLDRDLRISTPEEMEEFRKVTTQLGFRAPDGIWGYPTHTTLLDGSFLTFVWWWVDGKVPEGSRMRLAVLDRTGRVLSDEHFYSGWRIAGFEGVVRVPSAMGRPDLLCFLVEGMVIGARRCFFAVVDGHLEFVRMEQGIERKLVANPYRSPNHTIGPLHPPKDEADCLRDLEAGAWSRRLSLLTWLAGTHWDGTEPDVRHEEEAPAKLARRLQESPRIRAAVEQLSRAEDDWIRDAAALALRR